MRRAWVSTGWFLAAILGSSRVQAASTGVVAVAAPGPGQAGLAVGFDAAGALRAVSCASPGCAIDRGTELPFPGELRPAIASAQFSVVGIGEGRRAVVVSVSEPRRARAWSAVLVGALGGGEPRLVFSGFTGFTEGEEGMRRGKRVEISPPDDNGARRIVVGDVQEDLSLCGRPALLAPQLLASSDLKLHPAKVQRLSVDERERARQVSAVRVAPSDSPVTRGGVLRAVAATSGIGNPGALTDDDPESTWAENRGGSGRGEFVLLNAPPELAISGLNVLIRPPVAQLPNAVAPREFWIASARDLVHVTMPEDAWRYPGVRYSVKLDPPLQGDCLALVTESAFDENPKARVTFAEVSPQTEFDAASVPALVAALAGGGERAQAALAVLRAVGQPGFDAVVAAYDSLDEGGRRVALDLLDQAPCDTSLPVYLKAFSGLSPAHVIHARDHIRRCGKAAAPYLAEASRKAQGTLQRNLLGELLLADPAQCVDVIASLLDVDSRVRRASLRIALARASLLESAKPRVLALLADGKTSERVLVEVLRALGSRIAEFQPVAGEVLTRLQVPSSSFRTRFLLLGPSAELANTDPALRAVLSRELASAPDARFRAQALSVLKNPSAFERVVKDALSDPDMRVREAAIRASAGLPSAVPALSERLAKDPWPLVRMAAADALAAAPPAAGSGADLTRAIEDPSPHVRAHVITALGAQKAVGQLDKIRERLSDEDEYPMVRAAAAQAVAALCDRQSLDLLTEYAHKLSDPMADPGAHSVGAAALLALGDLRPPDLLARLQPLLAKNAPAQARQAAEAVLHRPPGSCAKGGQKAAPRPRVPAS